MLAISFISHFMMLFRYRVRGRGQVQSLTRQPTEGRSRDGGLRMGEMERDCLIADGESAMLNELFGPKSDSIWAHFCNSCNMSGTADLMQHRYQCRACQLVNSIEKLPTNHATKLLIQELSAMLVSPKLFAQPLLQSQQQYGQQTQVGGDYKVSRASDFADINDDDGDSDYDDDEDEDDDDDMQEKKEEDGKKHVTFALPPKEEEKEKEEEEEDQLDKKLYDEEHKEFLDLVEEDEAADEDPMISATTRTILAETDEGDEAIVAVGDNEEEEGDEVGVEEDEYDDYLEEEDMAGDEDEGEEDEGDIDEEVKSSSTASTKPKKPSRKKPTVVPTRRIIKGDESGDELDVMNDDLEDDVDEDEEEEDDKKEEIKPKKRAAVSSLDGVDSKQSRVL
jgi:hypothetical protein